MNSAGFKESGHENPPAGLEFKSERWQAENVSFGAFRLSERQIGRVGAACEYAFPPSFTSLVGRVFFMLKKRGASVK